MPVEFRIRRPRARRRPPSPAAVLLILFVVLVAVGTVLLSLPVAAADGRATDPLVALFTATSAASVTGLVLVDTATAWSPFGQGVILVLIQLGGFGFMSGSTLLLFMLLGRRTGLRDRLLVQVETGVPQLGGAVALLRRVALFAMGVEVLGVAVLFPVFLGRLDDPFTAAWWAVFHSVSAFNNAGFDVVGGFRSMTPFAGDPTVLLPLAGLVFVGGLGYAIVADVAVKRSWRRLALETRIVLATSAALLVAGTLLVAVLEWQNAATLAALDPPSRAVNALFHSVSARTAGFNAVPLDGLRDPTLIVLIALMFIGGASGSPAGGIKVNTFAVLLLAIVSAARGRAFTAAFGRRIPDVIVYRALAVALLSVAVVFVTTLVLAVLIGGDVVDLTFEAASALGTVGLSTGVTARLSEPAIILLAAAMFVGRLGPLTLVLALAARQRPSPVRPAVESLRIG